MSVSPPTTNPSFSDINVDISAAEHAKRLAEARNLSRRYALIAASLALLPLPVLDHAAVLALQVKMVYELSKLYKVSFNYREARPVLISLLSGFAVSGSGIVLISIGMAVPGLGSLVGGGLAGSLSGSTLATGEIFIRHFEAGGTLENIHQSQSPMLPSSTAPPLAHLGDTSHESDISSQNATLFVNTTNSLITPDTPTHPASDSAEPATVKLNSEDSHSSDDLFVPENVNVARIYGIGPTYQSRLHLAGIDDCEALSKLDPESICTILGQRVTIEIANDFLSQARALIQDNSS
jgi:uncharacterized protein (DUF697 family)/predicted flap endonuclease-1-like 5' DNA nuclease